MKAAAIAIIALTISALSATSAPDKRQAESHARQAEYYQREAASARRDADYYAREAESARRDALYYIRNGNASRARSCRERADRAIYNYRSKIDAARRADDRAADYLRRATDALER